MWPFRVDAEAVEQAGCGFGEQSGRAERAAVGADFGDADVARAVLDVGRAGVGDVEQLLVGREGEAVGFDEIGRRRRDRAAFGIDAIDVAGADLLRRGVALVFGIDAVGRIAEPDRAVRLHHDVVGRIEALALESGRRARGAFRRVRCARRNACGARKRRAAPGDRRYGRCGCRPGRERPRPRRWSRRSAARGCWGCPTSTRYLPAAK